MRSESGQTTARRADSVSRVVSGRIFHGWYVVAATFTMALLSFGLGFYGVSVYVATLQRLHGWSAATVSAGPVRRHVSCLARFAGFAATSEAGTRTHEPLSGARHGS